MNKYPHLMAEVQFLNKLYGTTGMLDAMEYIRANAKEYAGTACLREFYAFCNAMAVFMAPRED